MKDLKVTIKNIADMLVKNPQIKELDINPLFLNEKEAIAGDVRILMGESK